MSVDKTVVDRLQQLIQMGEKVKAKAYTDDYGYTRLDDELFFQWKTSSLSFLERVFGVKSVHYHSFYGVARDYEATGRVGTVPSRCLGILNSARDEYVNGYLFKIQTPIEAEVLDDLLEQAEHLHATGYHAPAAVIAGCVLENGLRKACERAGAALPISPKLDRMNAELAKQGVYSKSVQKQVTVLADIRNNAAHGIWDAFSKEDVAGMISQVRAVMATHLS